MQFIKSKVAITGALLMMASSAMAADKPDFEGGSAWDVFVKTNHAEYWSAAKKEAEAELAYRKVRQEINNLGKEEEKNGQPVNAKGSTASTNQENKTNTAKEAEQAPNTVPEVVDPTPVFDWTPIFIGSTETGRRFVDFESTDGVRRVFNGGKLKDWKIRINESGSVTVQTGDTSLVL